MRLAALATILIVARFARRRRSVAVKATETMKSVDVVVNRVLIAKKRERESKDRREALERIEILKITSKT